MSGRNVMLLDSNLSSKIDQEEKFPTSTAPIDDTP